MTKPSPSGATSQRRLCLQVPIEMQRFPQFTGSLGQLLGFAMPSTPCPSTVSNTRTATEAPKVQRPICADPRSMAAAAGSPSKPQRAPLYPRFFSFSLGQKGPVTNHRPLPVRSLRHAQLAQSRQGFSTSPGKTRDRQQQVVSGRSDHAILTSTGVLVFWAFLLECKCKPASCWLACLQPLGFLFEEVSIADRGCLGETPVWKECCTTKRKLHYIANSLAFFFLSLSLAWKPNLQAPCLQRRISTDMILEAILHWCEVYSRVQSKFFGDLRRLKGAAGLTDGEHQSR